jgi:exopolysaccharide biosynthesis polyprenyl glycosylphosphotransferase
MMAGQPAPLPPVDDANSIGASARRRCRRVCLVHADATDRALGLELCANGVGPARVVASVRAPEGPDASERLELRAADADEILIVGERMSRDSLMNLAQRCLASGMPVRVASRRFSAVTHRSLVEEHGGVPVLLLRGSRQRGWGALAKRLIDVMGAAAGLVLLAPVFAVIAAAIKLSSRGPVLYRQIRVGKSGVRFTICKFRSMVENCDENPHRSYFEQFIRSGDVACADAGGAKVYKLLDDPRITRVGRLLRRSSLDELPQLWNVLRGEMSLVGPRPSLPYEWDLYKEWQRARLSVIPGCTGLWQVEGRSRVSFDEMVLLDLCYIANWSLLRDVALILRTLPVMFSGRGGH